MSPTTRLTNWGLLNFSITDDAAGKEPQENGHLVGSEFNSEFESVSGL